MASGIVRDDSLRADSNFDEALPVYRGSSYLNHVLKIANLPETVRLAVKALSMFDYDAVAFAGMSGALIAAPVAFLVNKQLILVRKQNDTSQ